MRKIIPLRTGRQGDEQSRQERQRQQGHCNIEQSVAGETLEKWRQRTHLPCSARLVFQSNAANASIPYNGA